MAEARYKNMWKFLIKSNYEDAADIGNDVRCSICTRILINAHSSVCGCRYCLECVKAYLNGERRFCRGNTDECKAEEIDIDSNIAPDHAMNYRISKLIVACRYSCGYRCEMRNMEEHDRMCTRQPVDCPYVNIGCRETRLVTDRINEHFVEENESHARLLMTYIERLDSKITSMDRSVKEIDEARARETNKLVDQIKHELANLRNENQLAKEENNFLKAENHKNRTEYQELVATTEQQLAGMRIRGENQAREMELLKEKYNRSEKKLGELELQTRKEKEELRKNVDEVRDKQASGFGEVDKQVREMGISVDLQNGVEFVWPIDGWAAKSQSARDGSCEWIYSEAFYSHKNGYKMCVSVCPGGYGIDKGTHLSVYFYLMRGPFDNILPWPFTRAVTLSVIDQSTGTDNVSHTIGSPDDDYWKKPSTERNLGIGPSNLIALTELSSNAGLCKDDKLFIRCVVK